MTDTVQEADVGLQTGVIARIDSMELSGHDARLDLEGWLAVAQVFVNDSSAPLIMPPDPPAPPPPPGLVNESAAGSQTVTLSAPSPPPPAPSNPSPPAPPANPPPSPAPPGTPLTLAEELELALAGEHAQAVQECLAVADSDGVEECRVCPTNARAPRDQPLGDACECDPGFYALNGSTTCTGDCMDCVPCPTGTNCTMSGSTMPTLNILPGYFRPDPYEADVRPCPDVPAAQLIESGAGEVSGCTGGPGAGADVCRPGLDGMYCMQCNDTLRNASTHYYNKVERACLPCSGWILLYIVVGLGIVPTVLTILHKFAHGRTQRHAGRALAYLKYVRNSAVVASLLVTAKILVGFYQVVSEVEEVFIMRLPLQAVLLLEWFSFLRLDLGRILPLACFGWRGFTNSMRFAALLPLGVMTFGFVGGFLRGLVGRRRLSDCVKGGTLAALPWGLFVSFLVLPHVTSTAFQSFRCECYGEESYLRADYSLVCTTNGCPERWDDDDEPDTVNGTLGGEPVWIWSAELEEAQDVAWIVIVVYGITVPIMYGVLLHVARKTIKASKETELSRALGFLHNGYRPSCYWWEVSNMVRKLLTVGFSTMILPGTLMQLVIVLLVVLAFQLMLVVVQPFRAPEAGLLAEVEQFSLLVVILLCVLIKVDQLAATLDSHMTKDLKGRFEFDSGAVANLMVTALIACIVVAAGLALRRAGTTVSGVWRRVMVHRDGTEEDAEKERQRRAKQAEAQQRAVLRAKARAKLHAVLDAPAAALETPALSYAEDAVVSPILWAKVEAAKAEVRRAHIEARRRQNVMPGLPKLPPMMRPDGKNKKGQKKNAVPPLLKSLPQMQNPHNDEEKAAVGEKGKHYIAGALRLLKIEFDDAAVNQSNEGRSRAVMRYLQRSEGVAALRPASAAPEKAATLARHAREGALAPLPRSLHESKLVEQRDTCRTRLAQSGWGGVEKETAGERWGALRSKKNSVELSKKVSPQAAMELKAAGGGGFLMTNRGGRVNGGGMTNRGGTTNRGGGGGGTTARGGGGGGGTTARDKRLPPRDHCRSAKRLVGSPRDSSAGLRVSV